MSNTSLSKRYDIRGDDFVHVGEASTQVKMLLKQIGVPNDQIRRVVVAMYEGEINMVIHANGGFAKVDISGDRITIVLEDTGPGIADIALAMKEGYSTASDDARSLGFGAGMGLANMKKYTDEMTIESEVHKGTRVTMVVFM